MVENEAYLAQLRRELTRAQAQLKRAEAERDRLRAENAELRARLGGEGQPQERRAEEGE